MTQFWKGIWGTEITYNVNAEWLKHCQDEYCKNAKATKFEINKEIFDSVIKKLSNNKTPGLDLIVGYWIKYMTAVHPYLMNLYVRVACKEIDLPAWLIQTRTNLLAKNTDTRNPKNYRPIACENNMLKIYTALIAYFLDEHCRVNDIIALNQTGGRKRSWGHIDQLLINKTIAEEVVSNRRNLISIYLDYKKAFDSVLHSWIIESLKLAKVNPVIIAAIEELTKNWSTRLKLNTENEMMETEFIKYLRGIFQGDGLSLLLFVLSVNPLSFLLNTQTEGYPIGNPGERNIDITHLSFVDDLKLLATTLERALKQLDIVTTFSKDVGMTFGTDKCAYSYVERGKKKSLGETIVMNGVEIKELKEEERYTHLGIDESVSMDGELTKEKVRNEYLRRVKKIWKSELNARNKVTAHNCFAVSVFRATVGICDWTKEDLTQLDIRTRKLMTMNGSLHPRSDTDRLYIPRKEGGRGLLSIEDTFKSRMIALGQHLDESKNVSVYLKKVHQHEKDRILRLSHQLIEDITREDSLEIEEENQETFSKDKIKKCIIINRKKHWLEKQTHGYLNNKLTENEGVNIEETYGWIRSENLSSHVEGYIFSLQEQEVNTRMAQKQREKDPVKKRNIITKCRLCHQHNEDIFHILSSCTSMSDNMYLYQRHDRVAKIVYEEIIYKDIDAENKRKHITKPPKVTKLGRKEIWWNAFINLPIKVEHNRPDITIWDHDSKVCTLVEVCAPLDTNVTIRTAWKEGLYIPLVCEMSRIYPGYRFEIVPIVIGALGAVPQSLNMSLRKLNIEEKRIRPVTRRIQKASLIGSMKIVKTFLRF